MEGRKGGWVTIRGLRVSQTRQVLFLWQTRLSPQNAAWERRPAGRLARGRREGTGSPLTCSGSFCRFPSPGERPPTAHTPRGTVAPLCRRRPARSLPGRLEPARAQPAASCGSRGPCGDSGTAGRAGGKHADPGGAGACLGLTASSPPLAVRALHFSKPPNAAPGGSLPSLLTCLPAPKTNEPPPAPPLRPAKGRSKTSSRRPPNHLTCLGAFSSPQKELAHFFFLFFVGGVCRVQIKPLDSPLLVSGRVLELLNARAGKARPGSVGNKTKHRLAGGRVSFIRSLIRSFRRAALSAPPACIRSHSRGFSLGAQHSAGTRAQARASGSCLRGGHASTRPCQTDPILSRKAHGNVTCTKATPRKGFRACR